MNVRRSIAAAALLVAVPVLASCGFGEQTDQVYNAAPGVDDRSGSVDVLNALIVSGAKGSGTVVASLVNNDQAHGDALTGISAPGGTGLTVTGPQRTSVPAAGDVQLSEQAKYYLSGKDIVPGKFVTITFSFERSKDVTVAVPVMSASNPDYSGVPLPKTASPSASTSPSGSPSTSPSTSPTPSTTATPPAPSAPAPSAS